MGYAGNGATNLGDIVSTDGVISVTSTDADDLREFNVCYDCIGESYLSSLIETEGKRRRCNYCRERAKAVTLDEPFRNALLSARTCNA